MSYQDQNSSSVFPKTQLKPLNKALLTATAAICMQANLVHAQGNTDSEAIEEVMIYGQDINEQSSTGSRLNLSIMETPASVDIITGDSVRDRLDFTVIEAVTRTAGFTNEGNPGNGGQSIAARGFRGQGAVTKLYDGTSYFNAFGTITFPFDTWAVDQIEVLKGPSSVLYGEGGIGGAVNVIPKKPQQENEGHIRVTLGEDSTQFLGLSLTGGLTDTVAARVDYSNYKSDNWVDNGESETQALALALSWEASDDLTLTLRYDYSDQDPMRYFGIPVVNGDFAPGLLEKNFEVSDGDIHYRDQSIRLKADWNISDTAALQAEYFHLETDRYWRTVEYYQLEEDGRIKRSSPLIIGHDMKHDGVRFNFTFESDLAGLEMNNSVGLEFNDVSFERPSNFGGGNPNEADFDNDFDHIDDPNNFDPGSFSDVTSSQEHPDGFAELQHYALFAESQLQLSQRLALILALRYEDADTDYRQFAADPFSQSVDALTGRLGLVFDVNDATALYAQYSTGATHPSNSLVRATASNSKADFIKSEQIELGMKQRLFDDRLQWTFALFDIVKNDLIIDNPNNPAPSDFRTVDEQTSQGFELSVNYHISDALQVYGNASILDAEEDNGETPDFVPEKTANLGAAWVPVEKVRLIADARYVGERYHAINPIPSYTVVDASANYKLTSELSFSLKAENLFDETYASAQYYSDTWLVGKPRTLSITADYRF